MTNILCLPILSRPDLPEIFMIANDAGDMGASSYSIAKGILNINNGSAPALAKKNVDIPWNLIDREDGVKLLCPQEPVAQVDTVTIVEVPNADCCGERMWYYLTIRWKDGEEEMTHTYDVDFLTGSTTTKTQVSAAFIEKINADTNAIVTAAAVGETFTLTADTPGQGFVTSTNAALMTVAHTTPNVISFGDGQDLIDNYGFTAADGIDAANEYAILEIPWFTFRDGDIPSDFGDNKLSGQMVASKHKLWVLVETGGTAEDAVLGTAIGDSSPTDSLCFILAGSSTASKYLGVVNAGCPCS